MSRRAKWLSPSPPAFLLLLLPPLLLAPPASAQVQDKAQQACILGLQKASAKIQKLQAKENFVCVVAATTAREPDPAACITADAKGKVARALAGTQRLFDKKCTTAPDFGAAAVDDINDVSVAIHRALLADVLGEDTNGAVAGGDRFSGLCQRTVVKAYDKIYQAALKVLTSCQQNALRKATVTDGASLIATCLDAVTTDARGSLAKLRDKFLGDLDKRCAGLDLGALLPGDCAGETDAAGVASCIGARVHCRLCQATNGVGDLAGDCDLFDDGVTNGSCPGRLARCGDGVVDAGEECDAGAANSDSGADACRTDCRAASCGDGVVDTGETCDEGSANDDWGDGRCRTTCVASVCGDGVRDASLGEQCDDGNTVEDDFCSNGCQAQFRSNKQLVLLIDFSDTSFDATLPNAEDRWSALLFGTNQAEGNHYWNEIFAGDFLLEPVLETCGTPDNGTIHITLPTTPAPTSPVVVEEQTWIPDALDQAAACLDFAAYDTDSDGILQNDELSVLVVPHTTSSTTSGAGAQANIALSHPIGSTGVTLEKFARTQPQYSSIGVNQHELSHHIFDLDHFAPPTDYSLMGLGAYAEDPVITVLSGGLGRWGTRPTGLAALGRTWSGWVSPHSPSWAGDLATVTVHSIDSGNYNVVVLPIADGHVLIENRRNLGYDQSIPWCDGDQGGVFFQEIAQYVRPIDIVNLVPNRESAAYDQDFETCNTYALPGRNDAFSFGGYTFSNFSAAGPTMTFDVTRRGEPRTIGAYKWRWFEVDPAREGYRLWHHEEASDATPTVIDFADLVAGDDPAASQGLVLFAYYDTGEQRSVNKVANWSVSGSYVTLSRSDVTGGPATTVGDAIVTLRLDASVPCESEATVTAEHEGRTFDAHLINLPCDPDAPTSTPTPTPGPSPTPTPTPTPGPNPTPTPIPQCVGDPAPAWVDHGDGSATQCSTGLLWELKTGTPGVGIVCDSVATCPDPHHVNNRYTWSLGEPWDFDGTAKTGFLDVLNDVAGGGANCFRGRCNWRLATIEELSGESGLGAASGGTVDPSAGTCSGSSPACTTIPGETVAGAYWSSTTSSGTNSFAYYLNLSNGWVQHGSKSGTSFVRAVSP